MMIERSGPGSRDDDCFFSFLSKIIGGFLGLGFLDGLKVQA